MCLLRPCITGFFESLIAEILSQYTFVGELCVCWRLFRILLIHTTWHALDAAAINSASVVDRETTCCFLEDQEMAPELKRKT